ncbi:hypothetical protein [Nocardioides houyundeii]|uniref:hypothetical protein n=1 Tax=Nocardioides houyundeii TaxID=2045452 RepID=UPI000DF3C53A|nr:hypothetical protein [Nocardioides houyundeii]
MDEPQAQGCDSDGVRLAEHLKWQVDRLLDEGWKPRHVVLLTTGQRHLIQVERTDLHDQEDYWRSYGDVDVFYRHVLGCKGLERRAVVLCLNEDGTHDRQRNVST